MIVTAGFLVAVVGLVGTIGLNKAGKATDIILDEKFPISDASMEGMIALISGRDVMGEFLLNRDPAVLAEAQRRGFFVRSGRRLAVLLAWQDWCRATGHPEVVVRRDVRQSAIMIGDRDVEKVDHENAEGRAAELAREHAETLPGIIRPMEAGRKSG